MTSKFVKKLNIFVDKQYLTKFIMNIDGGLIIRIIETGMAQDLNQVEEADDIAVIFIRSKTHEVTVGECKEATPSPCGERVCGCQFALTRIDLSKGRF